MTAADLIARMKALSVGVIPGPRLDFPEHVRPDDRALIREGVKWYREEVLAEFLPRRTYTPEQEEMLAEVRRIAGPEVEPLIDDGTDPADLLRWIRDWDRKRREEQAKWTRWNIEPRRRK